MTVSRVIYDFGANNGDDIGYYLKKADCVVAVEASPTLCSMIEARFAREIAERRVFVLCCVITAGEQEGPVPFYLHKTNHVLSQFPAPSIDAAHMFEEVLLPALSPDRIIETYGVPHYIKIDLEHYDAEILRSLFTHGIFPDYISAESHSIEVFCLLAALGNYKAFKLVNGPSVGTLYANHLINTRSGVQAHSFPIHSAGPYGDDIPGPWLSATGLFRQLATVGLGWKDIHASRVDRALD